MARVYFTSDTHFGHSNIVTFCKRPFVDKFRTIETRDGGFAYRPDLDLMHREMTARWNSVVGPRDIVYHLGDFALTKRPDVPAFVKRLNGYKILIRGNHDRNAKIMLEAGFDRVLEVLRTNIDGVELFMQHKPEVKEKWNGASIHLCGHVHEKWRRKGNTINVGVDVWDFVPRTLQELMAAPSEGDFLTPEEMS